MPRISTKNQITLPVDALGETGLSAGDEVSIDVLDQNTIVVRRARRDVRAGIGVFNGLYETGYLDDLRSRERA